MGNALRRQPKAVDLDELFLQLDTEREAAGPARSAEPPARVSGAMTAIEPERDGRRDEDESREAAPPWERGQGVAAAYFQVLRSYHAHIIIIWALIALVGGPLALMFVNNCTNVFLAPEGTAAFEAEQKMLEGGFSLVTMQTTIVLIRSTGDAGVVASGLLGLEEALRERVVGPGAGAYNVSDSVGAGSIYDFAGYAYYSQISPVLAEHFISADKDAAILSIQQDPTIHGVGKGFASFMDEAIDECLADFPELRASQTGIGPLTKDAVEGSEQDLAKMDSVALPLALLTLSIVLNSWRVMCIPPLAIAGSCALSLGMMYPISLHITTVSFVPSVMMSCTIAFSFDYSLFVLSRFREELVAGATVEAAVLTTLRSAGHTVLMSGGTLAFAFAMMTLFPIDLCGALVARGAPPSHLFSSVVAPLLSVDAGADYYPCSLSLSVCFSQPRLAGCRGKLGRHLHDRGQPLAHASAAPAVAGVLSRRDLSRVRHALAQAAVPAPFNISA